MQSTRKRKNITPRKSFNYPKIASTIMKKSQTPYLKIFNFSNNPNSIGKFFNSFEETRPINPSRKNLNPSQINRNPSRKNVNPSRKNVNPSRKNVNPASRIIPYPKNSQPHPKKYQPDPQKIANPSRKNVTSTEKMSPLQILVFINIMCQLKKAIEQRRI